MDRIPLSLMNKVTTAEKAAELIEPYMTIGVSGFSKIGDPRAVPVAIGKLGKAHDLTLITGASAGQILEDALTIPGMVKHRFPYMGQKSSRAKINAGEEFYEDIHLSHSPRFIRVNNGPHIDIAIVECAAITDEGLIPGYSVGAADAFVAKADKVIIEINTTLPTELYGLHDFYTNAGKREPIPITNPIDRIGTKYIPCPPEKIAAIVMSDYPLFTHSFRAPDEASSKIANNIIKFLQGEIDAGRQPEHLNPIQNGVGNVSNAVLFGLGESGITGMEMYSELIQDSALQLMQKGIIRGGSSTSISVSPEGQKMFYDNLDFFKRHVVIRPSEISNHGEVIRRFGVIAINTPIEVDIYGNVNSSHISGTHIMNGIGGSNDFAHNAGIAIFATNSLAKDGKISCIVPMASHVDSTSHDVAVIVTEQGLADLRWKSPREKAELLIENCAHPDYKDMLWDYFKRACDKVGGQTPHILNEALSWHQRYLDTGSMK